MPEAGQRPDDQDVADMSAPGGAAAAQGRRHLGAIIHPIGGVLRLARNQAGGHHQLGTVKPVFPLGVGGEQQEGVLPRYL